MNNSRRELLKYFGVGAVIAPVIGGVTQPAQARLIELPRVELIEPEVVIEKPLNLKDVRRVDLLLEMADGTKRVMKAGVVTKMRQSGHVYSGIETEVIFWEDAQSSPESTVMVGLLQMGRRK